MALRRWVACAMLALLVMGVSGEFLDSAADEDGQLDRRVEASPLGLEPLFEDLSVSVDDLLHEEESSGTKASHIGSLLEADSEEEAPNKKDSRRQKTQKSSKKGGGRKGSSRKGSQSRGKRSRGKRTNSTRSRGGRRGSGAQNMTSIRLAREAQKNAMKLTGEAKKLDEENKKDTAQLTNDLDQLSILNATAKAEQQQLDWENADWETFKQEKKQQATQTDILEGNFDNMGKKSTEAHAKSDKLLDDAVKLDFVLENVKDDQIKARNKHWHYKKVLGRFNKHQDFAAKRDRELAAVQPYEGHLHVGDKKQKYNFMSGGPNTHADKSKLKWLEKYQLDVIEREEKKEVKPNVFRQNLSTKIQGLYNKTKPMRAGFLMSLLQDFGVNTTLIDAPAVEIKWLSAKNKFEQKKKIRAEQKALKLAKEKRKADKAAAKTAAAEDMIKAGKPIAFPKEKPRAADWLDSYPPHKNGIKGKGDNWWGCVDCVNPRKAKAKGKPGAKGAAALKKKLANEKKKLDLLGGVPVVVPPYDATTHNSKLLSTFLEEFKVKSPADVVGPKAEALRRKMKTAIVMSMLSQKEHDEILLAKTEELEKTIALKGGAPMMTKKHIPYYKPPSAIPFPPPQDSEAKEDPKEMDRQVVVEMANGYLEKYWPTDRNVLDNADEQNLGSRAEHEAFNVRYQVLPKKIVWRQFEGEGDSSELRADEVNTWRKAHPNEPLGDGTEPW